MRTASINLQVEDLGAPMTLIFQQKALFYYANSRQREIVKLKLTLQRLLFDKTHMYNLDLALLMCVRPPVRLIKDARCR